MSKQRGVMLDQRVPSTHRFLHGCSPLTDENRLWVLSGQRDDWFFHDVLHGCVDLRRTLELWALNGPDPNDRMDLTVTLDVTGMLDFSGNKTPDAARQRFEAARTRRPQKYTRTHDTTPKQSTPAPLSGSTDHTDSYVRQVNDQVHAANLGGAVKNSLEKLTKVIKGSLKVLVIVDDLEGLIDNLSRNEQTAMIASDLIRMIRSEWHTIGPNSLVAFLCFEPEKLLGILPKSTFRRVAWKHIEGPREIEIAAALDRMAQIHDFDVVGASAIARTLSSRQNLQTALEKVALAVNAAPSGTRRTLTLEKVLKMPLLNEEEITRIKHELGNLIGLDNVKNKVFALEKKARALRRKLLEGTSELPDETLHLVFTGSPGTGKTTVAKIIARLFHALGLLPRAEVKDMIASAVMSSNLDETREKMHASISAAIGGVLFIDEAHQFGDSIGHGAREAVQTLVPLSWNLRSQMVIILAGYADKMIDFYAMDDGLDSRFPKAGRIDFPDYSLDELKEILRRGIAKRGYTVDPNAAERLHAILRRRHRRGGFGNARGVENLIAEVVEMHEAGANPSSLVLVVDDLPPLVRRDPKALTRATNILDSMVGLEPIRQRLDQLRTRIEFDLQEEEAGAGDGSVNVHPGNMLFVGPPGTGKTTVALAMTDLLYGLGCIETHRCIRAGRAELVAGTVGGTALKTRALINEARGGILFIDEAYALYTDDRDSFGIEAINTLVQELTKDENAATVFILAGYRDPIRKLLSINSGLSRQFPLEIEFQNFSPTDCAELARRQLIENRFEWEDGLLQRITELATAAATTQRENFGNAGWLQNLLNAGIERMKSRVQRNQISPRAPGRRTLLLTDLDTPCIEDNVAGDTASYVAVHWSPTLKLLSTASAKLFSSKRSEIIRAISHCTFHIITRSPTGEGGATGFFVTPDGLMVTSHHVVNDKTNISVFCGRDRSPRHARVVRIADDADLALIYVDTEQPCAYLPLGTSLQLEPLTTLITSGYAHSLRGSPCRFVEINVSRNDPAIRNEFETDGAVEPGFSGGPVVDVRQGAVAGVVMGGRGPSAQIQVRAERVRQMLVELGYEFGGADVQVISDTDDLSNA